MTAAKTASLNLAILTSTQIRDLPVRSPVMSRLDTALLRQLGAHTSALGLEAGR